MGILLFKDKSAVAKAASLFDCSGSSDCATMYGAKFFQLMDETRDKLIGLFQATGEAIERDDVCHGLQQLTAISYKEAVDGFDLGADVGFLDPASSTQVPYAWDFSMDTTLLAGIGAVYFCIEGHALVMIIEVATILKYKGCLANPLKMFTGPHCDELQKGPILAVGPRCLVTVPPGSVAFIIAVTDPDDKKDEQNASFYVQHYLDTNAGSEWEAGVKKEVRHHLEKALQNEMQKTIYASSLAKIKEWITKLV